MSVIAQVFLVLLPLLTLALRRAVPIKRSWDYLSTGLAVLFIIAILPTSRESATDGFELVSAIIGAAAMPFFLAVLGIGLIGRGAARLLRMRLRRLSGGTVGDRRTAQTTLDWVNRFEERWLAPSGSAERIDERGRRTKDSDGQT